MWGMLTSQISITRRSAVLVASAAAAQTLTVAAQPVTDSLVEVSAAGGNPGSGTVYVTGLSAGVTLTEALDFSANGYRQTVGLFSSVAGMTSSGFVGETPPATLSARAVGRDGSQQHTEAVIVTGYPAAIAVSHGRYPVHEGGGGNDDDRATITVPISENFAPRKGDLITDEDGRVWYVLSTPPSGGNLQREFWSLSVTRYEVS